MSRHDLVIESEIEMGGGIVVPPIGLEDAVELAFGDVLRALEHQVFEKVGESRTPGDFLTGADPEEHRLGHHGDRRVPRKNHAHSVL